MIGAFIQSLLGDVGRAVFAFYEAYSLYINGIIILYGLSVFMAHRCFNAIFEALKKEMKLDDKKKIGKEKLSTMIDQTVFDWDALNRTAWFPFIALPGKITIHLKNKVNIQKAFSKENLLVLLKKK